MSRHFFINCVFSSSLTILFVTVSGLDLAEELHKQKKFDGNIPVASNVNMTWLRSTEIWFAPFVPRSALLLWTKNFVNEEEFKAMSEDYARQNSCFGQNWNEEFDSFGFGKTMDKENSRLKFDPIRPGVVEWEKDGTLRATTYFLMTDNFSYVVGVSFFADGSRTGFVMTPYNYDTSIRFTEEQVSQWEKMFEEVGFASGSLLELPVNCAERFWEDLKKQRSEVESLSITRLNTERPVSPQNGI